MVYGPIVHYLNSLDTLNTSNERFRNLIQGRNKDAIPETGTFVFIDVRDVALAHVRAIEEPSAAGKRFFATAGHYNNRQITEVIRKNFPEYAAQLPPVDAPGGDFPEGGLYEYDNSRTKELIGGKFRTLEESVVDTVKSLQSVGA